ncbi:MAG: glycosyltransferase [Anaerolineae bacterium]|nr:glycosyltransferase [Anaerolineae bacterium]
MKLLIVASSLDLQQPFSSTPSWWQLLKGLYEIGVELVVTTYQGPAIETLWWQAVPNPVKRQGDLFKALRDAAHRLPRISGTPPVRTPAAGQPESLSERLIRRAAQTLIAPRWRAVLDRLLTEQPDIDALLFLTIPLNHVAGVPAYLIAKHGKPVFFYDGDLPASLPQFRGFATGFRIYQGADPGEYTAVLGSSVGALEHLTALGARHVHTLHYAADPDIWSPLEVPQDIDVFFYGHGAEYREDWIRAMIAEPSRALPERRFAVRGTALGDLGRAERLPYLSFSKLRQYACRSRINLLITRQAHASVYASSNARPFELAALGACMVSSPYSGLETWFEPEKEVIILASAEEATERIAWLLDHEAARAAIGAAARARFLKEHTYRHRAQALVAIIRQYL